MSKGSRITVIILIILLIAILGYGVYINKKYYDEQNSLNSENTSNEEIENYENTENEEITNEIGNEENEVTTNTSTSGTTSTSSGSEKVTSSNVVGKEEQESSTENTSASDEEQAVELAKKEWGVEGDSYSYEANKTADKVYTVSVRNKSTTAVEAIYNVDLKTGEVTSK